MTANYHTHTPRCHHAAGTEKEYIENAIQAGFRILGFADHSPQFFEGGYVSAMRMLPSQAPEYVETIKRLAEEYRNDLQILVGFEAEYFPALFPRLKQLCRDCGVDYLILGQHFLHNEQSGVYVGGEGCDQEKLTAYVDEVIEGIETGCFTYVAHPDVCRYDADDAFYRREMGRLCRAAKAADVPLEINMLGHAGGRHYPCDKFFRIAKETGNSFVIGCDAHTPDFLLDRKAIEGVEKFAADLGITPLETVTIKSIL